MEYEFEVLFKNGAIRRIPITIAGGSTLEESWDEFRSILGKLDTFHTELNSGAYWIRADEIAFLQLVKK